MFNFWVLALILVVFFLWFAAVYRCPTDTAQWRLRQGFTLILI